MRATTFSLLVLMAAAMLFGCAPRKPLLYHWGSYEEQVYAMYSDTGKVPVEEQLEHLEKDYQEARASDKPVPPGYHAHMGYLYFQLGKVDQALQSFETEKALFPESATYMDRLIARAKH
jgi:hypothetical protein